MSDRPTEYAWKHRPLIALVERAPDTGVFVPDPRITVERTLVGSTERISEAELSVWLGSTTPAAGGEEAINGLACLNAAYRDGFGGPFISCDQRVIVVRRKGGEIDASAGVAMSDEYDPIMHGYCDVPEYDENGKPNGSSNSLRLMVRAALLRLSDAEPAQICGRWMRTAAGQDALDAAQARSATTAHGTEQNIRLVPGFPCVFNPGGKANCAAAPITATLAGEQVSLHVFTHDNDPDAVPWTYARMLRYLVYLHLYLNAITGSGPVVDGNVFDETEDLIELTPADRPTRPVAYDDAWMFAMLGVPAGFSVEGLNVAESLIAVADASGTRFWTPTEWDGETPVDKLMFWARGAGEKKWLHRTPFMTGATAREILEANDVNAYTVRVDYRDVVPNLKMIGDVRRYEITTELVPGWPPDSNLDNIVGEEAILANLVYAEKHLPPIDTEALVADPWYRQYHRSGDQSAMYANVGRRWILNTSGRYRATGAIPADSYARTSGHFTAARYAMWEPTNCGIRDRIIEDGAVTTKAVEAGQWARRPRPFLPCFTADRQRTSLGIVVQVSFDSGSTWHRIPELCPVALGNDSGIQFTCEDLTRIEEPESTTGKHFWEAIVRDTARVRVTAVIEGDDRLTPPTASGTGDASSALYRQIDVSDRFVSNDRLGGNSMFADGGVFDGDRLSATEDSRVDLEAIDEYTRGLLEILTVRQQAGAPRIPWITTDYMPGTSVVGIEGMGFDFAGHAVSVQRRYPDVIGVEYVGGQTALALDDWRVFDDYRQSREV